MGNPHGRTRMASQVQAVSSLYGGFWNFELQDFCYMTNRYFPPADLIGELASSLPELVKSYPSTNRHLSSLVAAPLGLTHEQVVVGKTARRRSSASSAGCASSAWPCPSRRLTSTPTAPPSRASPSVTIPWTQNSPSMSMGSSRTWRRLARTRWSSSGPTTHQGRSSPRAASSICSGPSAAST